MRGSEWVTPVRANYIVLPAVKQQKVREIIKARQRYSSTPAVYSLFNRARYYCDEYETIVDAFKQVGVNSPFSYPQNYEQHFNRTPVPDSGTSSVGQEQ